MDTLHASRAVGLLAALTLGGMALLSGCGNRADPSAPLSSGASSRIAESTAPESAAPDASDAVASLPDDSSAASSPQTEGDRPTGGSTSKPGGSTAGGGASAAPTRPSQFLLRERSLLRSCGHDHHFSRHHGARRRHHGLPSAGGRQYPGRLVVERRPGEDRQGRHLS